MNIAVIGSGAREHALLWKLAQDAQAKNLGVRLFNYGPTTNPGIQPLVDRIGHGEVTDVAALVQWTKQQHIDSAWIGPEAPLAAGVVDALTAAGVACVGPTQLLAQLESSKAFTRNLLHKYHIPASPQFRAFTSLTGIDEYIQSLHDDIVVKPDGLTGGKGVRIMGEQLHTRLEAVQYCAEVLAAGSPRVVIEERLTGQEFSLMSFSDGKHLVHMPVVQDHKRALVGDKGSNTGGMGTYTDHTHGLPFLSASDIAQAQAINQATLQALNTEFTQPYKGIMYGGFIAVRDGVRLIEYNARFGDPEVMNLMVLLQTSLIDITQAIIHQTLDRLTVNFAAQASVCKYIVPQGYPDQPLKDVPIDVQGVDTREAQLFYGSVDQTKAGLMMKGSRAVALVATGDTISAAEAKVESQVQQVKGQVFHRSDIGTAGLIQQRIDMLKKLRTT